MSRAARDGLLRSSTLLAGLAVLLQIAYPLTPARGLGQLSVLIVLVTASAGVTHARALHGLAWTARLALVVVLGSFAAEAVGVATGVPFGHYRYAQSLGPLLLGVPLLVPLAWLMMAYPCLVLARTLARSRAVVPLLAGGAMAAWDVFLDPQMVAAGHWTWRNPSPHLPGVDHVPLTNLAGWLLVSVVLLAVVDRACPAGAEPTPGRPIWLHPATTPSVLLGWTWLGGIVGNAAFFGRPWVAVWGGLALGVFVGPYLVTVRDRWRA